MIITLPPRRGGQPLEIDTGQDRRIVIIGANGAGKTRFAQRLASDLGCGAFRMSALKALYGREGDDPAPTSIDALYHRATQGGSLLRPDLKGEFERLLALLVNEEMLSLIEYKYAPGPRSRRRQGRTRLDHVMEHWQLVFPGNSVLVEGGAMLFGRSDESQGYSPAKLSDGEKTVLYCLGASTYAPSQGCILVDSPAMFLHPSSTASLWDTVEDTRPDCTFIYVTHDLQFASSRTGGRIIWVKDFDYHLQQWDYEVLTGADGLSDEMLMAILGTRKPVLFIEGDAERSIDAKLYPLIFNDYTVKPLGGCDRVIEATRTFNSLKSLHNLNAFGIVDRDRRNSSEVSYLRSRQVFVPEVAEIENMFMLEPVIRTMARLNRRDPDKVFAKVKANIIKLFGEDLKAQALQHTRHRMKHNVEHRIDGRFGTIQQLQHHLSHLVQELRPAEVYDEYCRDFRSLVAGGDYAGILKVYNRKTMLSESHVARLCGIKKDSREAFVNTVLHIMAHNRPGADELRQAFKSVFPPLQGCD